MPWQGTRDPYRVWLSEVMLQQTQVSTVLGYYARFLERFSDVAALAAAPADEVMALWSGLGYYSRARNLHRCAQVVVAEHGGRFPGNAAGLETLPGIGASTAAAIAAFCFGERISIVDGNVRRVLSRVLAFGGDVSTQGAQRELWGLAQAMLPEHPTPDDMTAYTQGLMDLGAGLCARRQPKCAECPVSGLCAAAAAGTVDRYPVKTRKVARRHESWWLLVQRAWVADGSAMVWLQRRPPSGIWAGLYCTPVFDSEAAVLERAGGLAARPLDAVAHSLTHRELRLHPLLVDVTAEVLAGEDGQWVALDALHSVGLPAPLRLLLEQLSD
jgi:A/G-specific adenine glycosylase